MADIRWPEIASDVISGQKVEGVKVVLAQIVSEIYAWVPEIVFELLHKQQNSNDVILCKNLKHIV